MWIFDSWLSGRGAGRRQEFILDDFTGQRFSLPAEQHDGIDFARLQVHVFEPQLICFTSPLSYREFDSPRIDLLILGYLLETLPKENTVLFTGAEDIHFFDSRSRVDEPHSGLARRRWIKIIWDHRKHRLALMVDSQHCIAVAGRLYFGVTRESDSGIRG